MSGLSPSLSSVGDREDVQSVIDLVNAGNSKKDGVKLLVEKRGRNAAHWKKFWDTIAVWTEGDDMGPRGYRAGGSGVVPGNPAPPFPTLLQQNVAENRGGVLTATNAVMGMMVNVPGSGSHTGVGKLIGWKAAGVRHGDTSNGLWSDDFCRISFAQGRGGGGTCQ